jgi:hypothetical protein
VGGFQGAVDDAGQVGTAQRGEQRSGVNSAAAASVEATTATVLWNDDRR